LSIKDARRGGRTPDGPDHREGAPMASTSVQRDERTRRLLMHAALREAEDRYRNELLDADERELLRERVISLKTKLAATS
jgi:hypothetical protein